MQKHLNSRYLYVVRHGQRKDHDLEKYPEFEGHPDAPLTKLGHAQAEEAGIELKKRLAEL